MSFSFSLDDGADELRHGFGFIVWSAGLDDVQIGLLPDVQRAAPLDSSICPQAASAIWTIGRSVLER